MRAQDLDASMKNCRDFCTKAVGKVEEAQTDIVEDMSAALYALPGGRRNIWRSLYGQTDQS